MSTRTRSHRNLPLKGTQAPEPDASGWVLEKVGDLGVTHDIHAKRALLDAYCPDDEPGAEWGGSESRDPV